VNVELDLWEVLDKPLDIFVVVPSTSEDLDDVRHGWLFFMILVDGRRGLVSYSGVDFMAVIQCKWILVKT